MTILCTKTTITLPKYQVISIDISPSYYGYCTTFIGLKGWIIYFVEEVEEMWEPAIHQRPLGHSGEPKNNNNISAHSKLHRYTGYLYIMYIKYLVWSNKFSQQYFFRHEIKNNNYDNGLGNCIA